NEDHLTDDMVFRSDINPASENFVQVLASGKITVFQEFLKKPEGENYSNGMVNHTRKYTLHTAQYALVNKMLIPLKFNSSSLEELTADKKSQVDNYIKQNNLKPKKEKDFIMVVTYYNSITVSAR
ncbi:MAG: hypothetical protein ABIS01_10250, partial [Ferruginibacter sp.]